MINFSIPYFQHEGKLLFIQSFFLKGPKIISELLHCKWLFIIIFHECSWNSCSWMCILLGIEISKLIFWYPNIYNPYKIFYLLCSFNSRIFSSFSLMLFPFIKHTFSLTKYILIMHSLPSTSSPSSSRPSLASGQIPFMFLIF